MTPDYTVAHIMGMVIGLALFLIIFAVTHYIARKS